jgi:hypothetical protein
MRKGSGLPLRTLSLGFGVAETAFHLSFDKEMNNKPTKVRKSCSHNLNPAPPPKSFDKALSIPAEDRQTDTHPTTPTQEIPFPVERFFLT